MKRNKIIYNRWLRTLLLSFALLICGGWMAWGQTTFTGPVTDETSRPKIILKNHQEDGEDWHDNVFHEIKTIYAWPDKPRELFIPELRINVRAGGDERFNWFVHWYVVKGDVKFAFPTNEIINEGIARLQGGWWSGSVVNGTDLSQIDSNREHRLEDYFVAVKKENGTDYGWAWSPRIRKNIWGHGNELGGGFGMDASTILFSGSEAELNNGIEIWCDVSIYQDGQWSSGEDCPVYTEPTLLKRYKYQIKNAQTSEIKYLEPIKYDYPYKEDNKTINFSMPYAPNNYFDTSGNQGDYFEYKVWLEGDPEPADSEYKKFVLVTRGNRSLPQQQAQRITKPEHYDSNKSTHVKVRVAFSNNSSPKVVSYFIFKPLLNSGFELEETIKDNKDRWPRRSDKYRMIGNVDFDNEEYENDNVKADELKGSDEPNPSLRNNMSENPFGSYKENKTTYGFLKKGAYTLLNGTNCSTSNQNIYGLFRSANKQGVSKDGAECGSGTYDGINWKRNYLWIPARSDYHANRTLYDRTYEITKGTEDEHCGYFYYIDASNDAGTLVDVSVDNICSNTELTVTAWVADMTRAKAAELDIKEVLYNPLAPNINLLFKGVKDNGEEVILHRFTSCDALVDYGSVTVDENKNGHTENGHDNYNLMQWQQLCYSFVVDEQLDGYKSFHLEVQNNEPHTDGADYAIDDIRVFMRKPQVSIMQAGDLCDTELKKIRFGTDYSTILQTMGLTPEQIIPENSIHRDVDWDEELPEELRTFMTTRYRENAETEFENYFTKIYYSIYEVKEDGTPEDKPLKIDYHGNGEEYTRQSYVSTRIEDMKWSDPNFDEDNPIIHSLELEIGSYFEANTDYIARVSSKPLGGTDGEPLACGACALVGDVFSVSVTGDRFTIIKSGETEIIKPDDVEKGGTYTISGVFKYREKDNGPLITLKDAQFDWFIGTFDEFYTSTVTIGSNVYTIQKAFAIISQGDNTSEAEAIQNALKGKEYNKDTNPTGQYVFGEPGFDYKMLNKYQSIIGLPRANQKDENDKEIKPNLYCTEPVLIPLGGTPPTIDPGDPDVPDPDPKDPEDPDDPKDDPKDPQPDKDPADGSHVRSVRVGLVQIQDMLAPEKEDEKGTLRVPIHFRKSAEGEIFVKDDETNGNVNITVCETSDSEFKEKADWNTISIATLEDLKDENTNPTWADNWFKIKFKSDHGFREGFWYMVKIPYAVKVKDGNVFYRSSMKLTLKIVPEYVTWVGSANGMHNWNNDGPSHWRRSTNAELYITESNKYAEANGTHDEAYTPMRFTKVTILGNEDGNSPYAAYPHLYELGEQAGKYILDMAPTDMDETIGAATKNIEYDLLADPDYEQELFGIVANPDKKENNHNYSCVRFYGNTCDEIYIKPESEILHTEYLTYNKAHVDYEMAPNRWYMLASPLKGVVSGDMYLPTGDGVGKYARQETPAFGEITYDNTNYTRWKPAVYMRGWKKSFAEVIHPNGIEAPANYAISAGWSNLYNDVDVPFTSGTGFSIGTKTDKNATLINDKVLFRLPKNDSSYSYYTSGDNTTSDNKGLTTKNRTGNGRFLTDIFKNSIENYEVETTEMFGNPFMSHLNMKEFFNGSGTYYILTGNGTTANIFNNEYAISTDDTDPKYVAPLQSFIVEGLDKATFTTAMIAKAPADETNVGLRSAPTTSQEESLPQLRITATRDGVRNTAVVAGLVTASDSYVEGEDAALLINEEVAAPQVYTLAGNRMTAINVTPELEEIPLGIYGKDATPVELSFKVSEAMKNVKLVDKQTGKHYDVTDGLTLTVPGNTSGRYYLRGSIVMSNEVIARNHIVFYNSIPGRIDVSSVDPLSAVTIYDISGRALRSLRNLDTPTVSAEHLAPGIYVVRAESGSQVVTEKVEVK